MLPINFSDDLVDEKKYGVGFVACRNSTHYGIAGYYATMATDQGCVGFTGTNELFNVCTFTKPPLDEFGDAIRVFGLGNTSI